MSIKRSKIGRLRKGNVLKQLKPRISRLLSLRKEGSNFLVLMKEESSW